MVDVHLHAGPEVLLYDGSFEGFLTVVFEATRDRIEVDRIVAKANHEARLFEQVRWIELKTEFAERVWNGLVQRAGKDVAAMVHGAFLSEMPGIETALWNHLKLVFSGANGSLGKNVLDVHVHTVYAAAQKVQHEAHRFLGFVRFSKAPDGSLYSVIAPDHNILERLGPHFSARFPNETWMIADSRRGICLRHDRGGLQILSVDTKLLPKDAEEVARIGSPQDARFRDLWKTYYDSVNIAQRANPRLMASHLPRKYWRYLPERQGSRQILSHHKEEPIA